MKTKLDFRSMLEGIETVSVNVFAECVRLLD